MKKISVLVFSLLLVMTLLSGCGGFNKAGQGMELTAQKELNKLFADPEAYKNKEVALGAYIIDKASKGSADVGFAICNDLENEKNYAVVTYKGKDFKADLNSFVHLKGKVVGTAETEGLSGSKITVPKIEATSVVETSALNATAPATRVIDVNKKIKKESVEVSIEKVAFADRETRVYIKVTNNSDDAISNYGELAITQKEKEYKIKNGYSFQADDEVMVHNIFPGTYTEGVITFDPIKQSDFTLKAEFDSADYDIDMEPFIFNVKVDKKSKSKEGETEADSKKTSGKLDKLFENPKSFKGKEVTLGGYIWENKKISSTETELGLEVEVSDESKMAVVSYKEGPLESIEYDNIVKVTGKVTGTKEIKNMLGIKIEVPVIEASKVEISDYMNAVAPVYKTVEVNDTAEQYGITVKLDKVEFAESETRFFVTLTNNSSDPVDFYRDNLVVQNKRLHREMYMSYKAEYPEFDESIEPGASSSGILVFSRLEAENLKLYIQGNSDNYDIELEPFKFDITVK